MMILPNRQNRIERADTISCRCYFNYIFPKTMVSKWCNAFLPNPTSRWPQQKQKDNNMMYLLLSAAKCLIWLQDATKLLCLLLIYYLILSQQSDSILVSEQQLKKQGNVNIQFIFISKVNWCLWFCV